MTTTKRTVTEVEQEVKALLKLHNVAGSDSYVTVREMWSGGSKWRAGTPSGQFTIELWGLRTGFYKGQRGEAAGKFRTKKDGTVPTDKLVNYIEQQLGRKALANAAEAKKASATKSTATVHANVVAHAKFVLPNKHFSAEYRSTFGGYITNDTSEDGKVAVNVGTVNLNESQAKALLDLLATFG